MTTAPLTDPMGSGTPMVEVRLRFDVAYDGTDFSGWAAQPGRRTVEGELSAGLSRVLRQAVRLTVAGRTDSGVHAAGQVAHADVSASAYRRAITDRRAEPSETLALRRFAGVLPRDLRVIACVPAPEGFDARFSALSRTYRYRISDAPWGGDPLRRDTTPWRRPLDVPAMAEAAEAMSVGEHDFLAYCRPRVGASTVRSLQRLEIHRESDGVIVLTVVADAFCHHMVRALTGALTVVGEGRRPPAWPAEILRQRQRNSAVLVAPAQGLTLVAVRYPAVPWLADRARQARRFRGPAGPVPGSGDGSDRVPTATTVT